MKVKKPTDPQHKKVLLMIKRENPNAFKSLPKITRLDVKKVLRAIGIDAK